MSRPQVLEFVANRANLESSCSHILVFDRGYIVPTTIVIRDETMAGKTTNELSLDFLTETIDVRELIRSRVYQEVQDFNRDQRQEFRGLVEPTDAERTLNGCRLRHPRQIDWKEQFNKAVEAFDGGQVLILVDQRQASSLDEKIVLRPDTDVAFLRLTPLVGG